MGAQIFEIIDNQIKANDPPETGEAMERLLALGWDQLDAKKMVGQCIAIEIFNVMKHQEPFNKERYVRNLNKLPEEPFGD